MDYLKDVLKKSLEQFIKKSMEGLFKKYLAEIIGESSRKASVKVPGHIYFEFFKRISVEISKGISEESGRRFIK